MSGITTHVLDTALGRPAAGVPVALDIRDENGDWRRVAEGRTDDDGRLRTLLPADAAVVSGIYRLVFGSARYFANGGVTGFFPSVTIEFSAAAGGHYHVPLLLSPYGYSTYRGS
jgi:5-hydroxyisourate hydrolase